MSLVLNEDQVLLGDSVRSLLADNAPITEFRKLRDSKDANGVSLPLWQQLGEMGIAGVLVPEEFGGVGLGLVEAGVVMEELAHTLTPSPFFAASVVAATALLRGGSTAQHKLYLPRIASGELIATLAVDETARHSPARVALSATAGRNGHALNGSKLLVLDGHIAELFIVAARTAGKPGETNGISLFLVPAKAPGVRIERTALVDSNNAARIEFKDVQVGADALLGKLNEGWAILEATLDAGRAVLAAHLLGAADETYKRTVSYLRERKQFGHIIGEYQGLQHRASLLFIELEMTRAAVLQALQSPSAATVSVAKARAGATATLAVQEGVQMHGGIGMTDEFDIGFFMKRVRVCQELFGDTAFHTDRLARLNGY